MSTFTFKVGAAYTRAEVRQAVGLDPEARGGPWYTGYAQHDGIDFIFCSVGGAGRTGHDYPNAFDDGDLIWFGKTDSHKGQPSIVRMTSPDAEVHIFWREGDRDAFTYAGRGSAIEVDDSSPVRVRWRFRDVAAVYPG